MMDETKVQIGDDVLLDIGTHSDWYISVICYNNESVNVELRRKTDRNNKWWVAEQIEPTAEDCDFCKMIHKYWYEHCDTCEHKPKDELQTEDYCDSCNHKGCEYCISDGRNPYCVPSNYEPRTERNE